jgi:hypothetical protein
MSTDSTVALNKTVVARLIAAGITHMYVTQAPDLAVFPYGVLRRINVVSAPEYNNTRENFDFEITIYGRPRSTEQAVEALADIAEQSLLGWRESGPTLGLSFGRSVRRDTLPPPPDPGDRELVQVRLLISCATWPRYLTTVLV